MLKIFGSFQRRVKLARVALGLSLAAAGTGCASYAGTAKAADPSVLARQGHWQMVPRFPLVLQEESDDCGAAALASVLRFWGRDATPAGIEAAVGQKNSRLRAGDMATYAKSQGLRAFVFFGNLSDVTYELARGRPVIVGLGKALDSKKALAHYEVVVGYEPDQERVLLLDPAHGFQVDSVKGFSDEWMRSKGVTIVTFLPTQPAQVSEK